MAMWWMLRQSDLLVAKNSRSPGRSCSGFTLRFAVVAYWSLATRGNPVTPADRYDHSTSPEQSNVNGPAAPHT
jgi:hypothetical protein